MKLEKLLLEIQLWIRNQKNVHESILNWQFTQASEQLKDYLTNVCEIDLWSIEIDANTMVALVAYLWTWELDKRVEEDTAFFND